MRHIKVAILLIIFNSSALFANDLRSVTVTVKLINSQEYKGSIIERFPKNFVFDDQTLTNYFKNLNRDSISIENEVIVDANGYLLRFSEKSSIKSMSPKEIVKIHLVSIYNKPVPIGSQVVNKEEFEVVSKELNALHYISPDKISQKNRLGFLFLSFGEAGDLKYFVDEFLSEIEKSKQSNNLDNIAIKSVSIKKEAIKKNIYLYYDIN